jgi:hypothetical protein
MCVNCIVPDQLPATRATEGAVVVLQATVASTSSGSNALNE